MTAYVVFTREEMVDEREFAAYAGSVEATFAGHDVTLLADYGPLETLEGAPVDGAVILSFPNTAAAHAWYHSDAYQAVAAHRFAGARYRGFIVTGLNET